MRNHLFLLFLFILFILNFIYLFIYLFIYFIIIHLFLLVVTECSVISPHRRLICGPNTIDVEITPIWKLLIKEVISIFSWCWLEKFGSSQIIKNVICQW